MKVHFGTPWNRLFPRPPRKRQNVPFLGQKATRDGLAQPAAPHQKYAPVRQRAKSAA